MDSKHLVWIFMLIGSTVGSFIPLLWGGDALSFSSLLLSALGAIAGIYTGFKISRY